MRFKDGLNDIDDVAILYKYLYLDPNNRIIFNNGITNLEIRMTDSFRIMCRNLNFPHLPETAFSETMTLDYVISVVTVLKCTKPESFPDRFHSRWDEIKTITDANCALNLFHT